LRLQQERIPLSVNPFCSVTFGSNTVGWTMDNYIYVYLLTMILSICPNLPEAPPVFTPRLSFFLSHSSLNLLFAILISTSILDVFLLASCSELLFEFRPHSCTKHVHISIFCLPRHFKFLKLSLMFVSFLFPSVISKEKMEMTMKYLILLCNVRVIERMCFDYVP
jgi:hypothetical protein